jgi:type II secretory pathway component PulJ
MDFRFSIFDFRLRFAFLRQRLWACGVSPRCAAGAASSNRKSKIENRKSLQAFTLFEVLTAIMIFMLLAGGIFATVQAAFTASTEIAGSQLDGERLDAFRQLARRLFASLPADAKVEMRIRKQSGSGDVVEVLAWPIADFLRFGAETGDGVAISALPDGRGGFRMALGWFASKDPPDERDRKLEKTDFLTLLPGVKEVHWKFAPQRSSLLDDKWPAGSGRPGLAELTLVLPPDRTVTTDFWVPPLQRRSFGGGEGEPQAPPQPGGQPPPPGESGEGDAGGDSQDGGAEQ